MKLQPSIDGRTLLDESLEAEYLVDERLSTRRTFCFVEGANKLSEGFFEIGTLRYELLYLTENNRPKTFSGYVVITHDCGTLWVVEKPDDLTRSRIVATSASTFVQILEAYRRFLGETSSLMLRDVDETTFQSEKQRAIRMMSEFYSTMSIVDPLVLASRYHFWFLDEWAMDQGLHRSSAEDYY